MTYNYYKKTTTTKKKTKKNFEKKHVKGTIIFLKRLRQKATYGRE